MGQGGPAGALGAGPLRPGPGWLGTKARECGLGRPAEPPGVSHLYFRGLGNHWLSPPASSGLGPSPLPGQPRAPAAAGKASLLGLPAPPLQPTCPLPAPSSWPLSSGSSEQGLGVRTQPLGPTRPLGLALWASVSPSMTEEGNPISGAEEALGRQNSFRLCFSPKERELPALLVFFCRLRALSVFQGPSQYLLSYSIPPHSPHPLYSRPAAGRTRDFSLCLKCGCLWERQPIKTRPARDP